MSFSHFEILDKKRFVGRSTVTNNKLEISGAGKIPSLWTLCKEKNEGSQIALYSNYESDEYGTYTFSLGSFTELQPEQSTHNVITLPASTYAVFVSRRGLVEEVVLETWQEIWTWDKKSLRTYTGDFEVYDHIMDQKDAQVAIYVAVNHII
ncbi:AraC family transcriptional regulator [Bacillus sp. WMMC1349]|uniref:GyrI-like domain-containing protein n=1 Tax=Bacillus sp. WMMC1349 TaxID=2736254 RepID=UPI001555871B|nr:GyrI-like domain-containing protein [Bacillus sp. WMMC1349]NPC93044.1 AraC family transcriptional regulator [Bacillus sp. WMMC1349]